MIVPSEADIVNDVVPVYPVSEVSTEKVTLAGKEPTVFDGVNEQVAPDGQLERRLSVTVAPYPPVEAKLSVYDAVVPAPTLWDDGDALIVKSGPVV